MPTITFKAKQRPVYNMDDSLAYIDIKVPAIKTNHCDMQAFRTHAKYGSYANSDLFQGMLKCALKQAGVPSYLKIGSLPECVEIDESGFLTKVTITLD